MELAVKNISFGYDNSRLIFDGLTFSCKTPEIMCILGGNGTGKSTLLKCLVGENNIKSGNILIDGKDIKSYNPKRFAQKIAYLPQTHIPSFSFSVTDVVMMGRTSRIGYFSNPGKAEQKIALEKLEYLNISHLADKPYTATSGGERQLVMIAAALAQEPELIVLDEPTSHLDFGNQFRFIQLVERLNKLGIGVLMTTHFPDHALYLNCSTIILHKGKILDSGMAKDVITKQNLSKIYNFDIDIVNIRDKIICVPIESL